MPKDRYDGFDAFVHARAQALTRYAYLLTSDAHVAQDLVQHAMTAVAERWPRLRDGNPEAYAKRVLVNAAASRWRRRVAVREDVVAALPESAHSSDAMSDVDDRLAVEEALRLLGPRQRAVLVLRFYDDMTEAQAAAVLRCSAGTVKSQTHRALARLRELAPGLIDHDDAPLVVPNSTEVTS